jgi:CotH kinase protein/Lamin Tail Domain/Secretion system C-terminal sorting domain
MFRNLITLLLVMMIAKNSIAQCSNTNHWETIITDSTLWKYKTPFTTISSWELSNFNDATWATGKGGIGYGDADDSTIVPSNITSLYLRKSFTVTDTSAIENLILNVDYDDGYIAYLNGVEIARSAGINDPIDFNTLCTQSHEANLYQGGLPESTVLNTSFTHSLLIQGVNVLAIAVFNIDSFSSDLSIRSFLHASIRNANTYFYANPSWFSASNVEHYSTLPIFTINTNGQLIDDNVRIIADMGIIDNGAQPNCRFDIPNLYNGKISVEYRGSTSQYFPKKPMGLSTVNSLGADSNISLWHYPAEHDWILLNTYNDKTFQRDEMAYNLASEMGWYASRTKHVVVYINDEYQGVYLFLEKLKQDKGRIDITKLDAADTTTSKVSGGYIWKLDKFTGTTTGSFFNPISATDFQYQYPKGNTIQPQQAAYLQNYISNFETQLFNPAFADPDNGYRKFANVFSFVDEHLILELANNVDGYRLSTFMHKDADSKCGRFTKGPVWDYNLSFGNADYCNGGYAGWQISDGCGDGTSKYTKQMLLDNWFDTLTVCRWKELRQTIFHKDSLWARVDAKTNYLRSEIKYDSTKWQTIGNYVWPNGWVANSWQAEVDSMKAWIANRLLWMDSAFEIQNYNCGQSANNGIVIDEINYKDANANGAGDWIELWNTSNNTVDLSNAVLMNQQDRRKYCVLPRGTTLLANQRLVVYNDSLKFATKHPTVTVKYGPLCFSLNNNGQDITLLDSNNKIIASFVYSNAAAWPQGANGLGTTMQLKFATANEKLSNSWTDGCIDGTPGLPIDPTCFPLSIGNASSVKMELHPNPFSQTISISNIPEKTASIEMMNMQGIVLLTSKPITILSTANLPNGVYLVVLKNNAGKILAQQKVVKL